MITLPLDHSPSLFSVRTRPALPGPFDVRLQLRNAETEVTRSITDVTASYDYNDFLNITCDLSWLPHEQMYSIEIIQLSASLDCNTLYWGGLIQTERSASVRDSIPMESYTSSSDYYIMYNG